MQAQSRAKARCVNLPVLAAGMLLFAAVSAVLAQAPPSPQAAPIAIVPIDSGNPGQAATVTGALEVTGGRAIIAASGSVTSGNETTRVLLPHRGELRVCASTTVKLAADASVPSGDTPGLLMAIDHGAVEMSFATTAAAGRNSDVLLTPDFRILVSGPGAAEVKVRLGQQGDTCVDNAAGNAAYVLISSVFEGGAYRVQSGQHVMFQHGSLHEVVDNEKEPCGCPPGAPKGNEFPLAQSEGLAPLPKPAPGVAVNNGGSVQSIEPLIYKSADHAPKAAAHPTGDAASSGTAANPAAGSKKPGFFNKVGNFFRRIFGAE